jgi:hypothetical protein
LKSSYHNYLGNTSVKVFCQVDSMEESFDQDGPKGGDS